MMLMSVLQVALTALLSAVLTLIALWLAWSKLLRSKVEATLSSRLDVAFDAIRTNVQEGAEAAILAHKDDIAVSIEERVKAGAQSAIDERLDAVATTVEAHVRAGVEAGVEAKLDEVASTVEDRVRQGVEDGIETQREGVASLIEQRVHDGARDGLQAGLMEVRDALMAKAKGAVNKAPLDRLDDVINLIGGNGGWWKKS